MITPLMNRSTEELIGLATGRHWTAFGESLGQGNMPKVNSKNFHKKFGTVVRRLTAAWRGGDRHQAGQKLSRERTSTTNREAGSRVAAKETKKAALPRVLCVLGLFALSMMAHSLTASPCFGPSAWPSATTSSRLACQ